MAKRAKRVTYPDFLDAIFDTPSTSKYVSDTLIRGRRIVLRQIGVSVSISDGRGKVELSPVIPCVGPALRLLQKHPKLDDIIFDREKRRWEPTDWKNLCEPNTKKSKTRSPRGASNSSQKTNSSNAL